ncbi:hypothetical protein POTOM_062198 [Populus tomentosa]|uniref:Legume lectin domain-containing protein n=1 Tax=Populus tomentosa TaxID=118781 RepID=A0A8X8BXZ2_POPTO|nr:hypothetical protein POTOM_062198 [Populus tomentosa]
MYIGFSSSTGSVLTSHYLLGWSFKINGQAEALDISQLPKLPRIGPKKTSRFLTIGLPVICLSLVLVAVSCIVSAGQGTVGYRWLCQSLQRCPPTSKVEIAVKRVSHESRQVMRDFSWKLSALATFVTRTYTKWEQVVVIEVASGGRPIQPTEDANLVDWVFTHWLRGEFLEARDPNLEGGVLLPDISPLRLSAGSLTFSHREGFEDFAMSYPSSMDMAFSHTSSIAESLLSGVLRFLPISCQEFMYNLSGESEAFLKSLYVRYYRLDFSCSELSFGDAYERSRSPVEKYKDA